MTEEEYQAGLVRLDELWETKDVEEMEELNILADLLDNYERTHFRIRSVDFSTLP